MTVIEKGITREDVIFCYRYFLGREPESNEVIDEKINAVNSVEALINCFVQSEEYANIRQKNSFMPVDGSESYSILKSYTDGKALNELAWVVPIISGKEVDSIKLGVLKNDKSLTDEVYEIEHLVSDIIGEKENKGFLDLGANIGKFLFPFSKMGGWKCYAVEAADDNFEGLLRTCMLNDCHITVLNNIIYEFSGDMYFYANGPYGMCSKSKENILHRKLFEGQIPIPLKSICLNDWKNTEFRDIKSLDFIKMDVEGSEVATIRGANRFLEFYDYPSVFCESNKWTLYIQGETPDSLRKTFVELGYDQYVIQNGMLYMVEDGYVQLPCNTDYLFVHSTKRDKVKHEKLQQSEQQVVEGVIEGLRSTNELELLGNYYSLIRKPLYVDNKYIWDICDNIRKEKSENPIWEYALSYDRTKD